MPVFPLVGSSRRVPGRRSPEASPASSIAFATRSLIEPDGFWPSSFATMRTPGLGERRESSTSGVDPTRSRSDAAIVLESATRHGGEEDHLVSGADARLEPVAGADVLAADEHVHERRELPVLQELRGEQRVALDEVVEHLSHRRAIGCELARATDLGAERGWDAHGRHQIRTGALQNST